MALEIAPKTTVHPVLNSKLITAVAQQTKFFGQQGAAAPVTSRAAIVDLIKTTDPIKLLYFFCHANTVGADPFTAAPSTSASLLVDDLPLTIDEMAHLPVPALAGSPLVFLNACSSAQGDSAFQSAFVEHFMKRWAARGVVGTDWEIPTAFADLFARRVLEKLLVEERPLGDAFHQVTLEAMKDWNPFGLIYAIYAPPEIVATHPKENLP